LKDFSKVKTFIDTLIKRGVKDFGTYFAKRPDRLLEAVLLIKVLEINRSALKLNETESKETLRNDFPQLFFPQSNKAMIEQMNAIGNGVTEFDIDSVLKTFGGKKKHVNVRWLVVPGHEEKLDRVLISNTDITARKRAEQDLIKSKELTERYLNLAGSIIASLNKKGEIVMINQQGLDILGYSQEELIGKNWFNTCIPINIRKEVEQIFIKMLSGTIKFVEHYENDIVTKSGKVRTIAWHNTRVNKDTGEIDYVLGSGVDVIEQKIANRKTRESEERFNLAMNATEDGLYDWDLLTNNIYYSPGWKSMLGYDYNELPNDYSVWENLTKPKDVKRCWDMQQELLQKKRDRFEIEFQMKHKDGHWVNILSRANAIFDNSGNAIKIIGTHVDITQRKKNEIELINSKKELRAFANHLECIREEERAMIAREIHDEFGQVLTALKLNINYLEKGIENGTDSILSGIGKEFEFMYQIIDNSILKLRNLISLLRPDELDKLGLSAALENLVTFITRNRNITFSVSIKTDDNSITSDISLIIYRTVQEALSNSLKHSNATRISVKTKTLKKYNRIVISDNGIGFNVSQVNKTKSFGLMGMQERIHNIGGHLFIKSDRSGTQIRAEIPI
jgi:PAS domain S-box-containing protein